MGAKPLLLCMCAFFLVLKLLFYTFVDKIYGLYDNPSIKKILSLAHDFD
jgi:hypothetical protein